MLHVGKCGRFPQLFLYLVFLLIAPEGQCDLIARDLDEINFFSAESAWSIESENNRSELEVTGHKRNGKHGSVRRIEVSDPEVRCRLPRMSYIFRDQNLAGPQYRPGDRGILRGENSRGNRLARGLGSGNKDHLILRFIHAGQKGG